MRYIVELEGTIELEAADELEAEDKAMDFVHGDFSVWEDIGNAEMNFTIINTKEID